ncbi:MAG TPA: hypothetical protein VGK67_11820 [Myxococcales bacterium]
MARSVYIVALLLPACGGASLQDFGSSELTLDLTTDGRIAVSLGAGGSPGACRRLDGPLRATVNGRDLQIDSRGGEVVSTAGWSCAAPEFSATTSDTDAGDALIEISDGESELVLLARNAFAERKLSGHGVLAGGRWTFLWSPPTDENLSATWRLDSGSGTRFGQVEIEDGELVLDLSAESLSAGSLRVDGLASTPIDRCEGVARCSALVRATSGEIRLSGGVE